jgi:hypothetical protein
MFEMNVFKNSKIGMAKNVNANKGDRRSGDISQAKAARYAGLFYLLLIIFGVTAELLRQSIIVPGDASTTAANLMANETVWHLSLISDVLAFSFFALLPLAFYAVFNKVNKNLALLVVIFVLVSIPIIMIALTYQYGALELVGTPDKVMENIETYTAGVHLATIFHGLWLFPLGILVYRSGYFPRFWGVLQMLACFGFIIDGSQHFLLPGNEAIAIPGMIIAVIAEFGFTGWLLVKGARIPEAQVA